MDYCSGAITATKKLMGVSGSFIIDDVNTYAVTSELKIDESKNGMTYTPLVEIRRPDADNMALTGMVTMESMKSATADLTLSGLTAQPLAFKCKWTEWRVPAASHPAPSANHNVTINISREKHGE